MGGLLVVFVLVLFGCVDDGLLVGVSEFGEFDDGAGLFAVTVVSVGVYGWWLFGGP